MREVVFIEKNKERWQHFEASLSNTQDISPDIIADLFVQITDDLSYSRTNYPKSATTNYLNSIALKAHQLIYRNKKEKSNRITTFYKEELPIILYHSKKQMLYSFLIFGLAVLIGVLSAKVDDNFVRIILGDSYVNMTLENIEKGDPMAVYKKMNQGDMFLGITLNNTKVMFLAFVAGILFSAGTAYILFSNGIMLGSFQYFFYAQGVFYESVSTIWIHGTIEIFCIIVSGAAGLALGNSLLFPGTFSRGVSVTRGARHGVKIAVGLVPFITIAGFLEGFVTRLTHFPPFFHWAIIGGSVLLIYFYFFYYPAKIYKRTQQQLIDFV